MILLIDDAPGMDRLVAMILEGLGGPVVQAVNLAGALAAARAEAPGVVLLDLALGEEDGLAILPTLRGEPALSRVPVVGFTVHESRRHEAMEAGLAGFVVKPFTSQALRKVLEPYLTADQAV